MFSGITMDGHCQRSTRSSRLETEDLSSPPEFEVKFIDTYIGRGVFVKEDVRKNQFLMEYTGELTIGDCDSCEDNAYKFYFRHKSKDYCIDASKNLCMAAMVNDIDKANKANCRMIKKMDKDGRPKLCLFTVRDIEKHSELRYDYGVTSAPWRNKENKSRPILYEDPSNSEITGCVSLGCGVFDTESASSLQDPANSEITGCVGLGCGVSDTESAQSLEDPANSEIVGCVAPGCDVFDTESAPSLQDPANSEITGCVAPGCGVFDTESAPSLQDPANSEITGCVAPGCGVFDTESAPSLQDPANSEITGCVAPGCDVFDTESAPSLQDPANSEITGCVAPGCGVFDTESAPSLQDPANSEITGCVAPGCDVFDTESAPSLQDPANSEITGCVAPGCDVFDTESAPSLQDPANSGTTGCGVFDTESDPSLQDPANSGTSGYFVFDTVSSPSVQEPAISETTGCGVFDSISAPSLQDQAESETGCSMLDSVSALSFRDSEKDRDETFNEQPLSEIESSLDDSMDDPDFKMHESDESYVSDSDNSVIVPFQLPLLKTNFDRTHRKKIVKKRKRVDSKSSDCETMNVNTQKEEDYYNDSQNENANTSESQKEDEQIVKRKNCNEDTVKLQPSGNVEGRRRWDKIHYCVYCEKSFTNITKHLLRKHKKEKEVVEITNLPLNSKRRKDLLLKLRNAGDYNHNMHILKNGKGTLITFSRKEGANHSTSDYLPCEDCLGFFAKETLWKHRRNCAFKKDGSKRKAQSAASFMLPVSTTISHGLKENVLKKMAYDDISLIVRNDSLILKVGEKLYEKHGQHQHLNNYISQKMRELGRLIIHARQICSDIQHLSDIIVPERFRTVAIVAARNLCKYNDKNNTYGNPSLAMKLGHLLKKCAKIKKSDALISRNEKEEKDADGFSTLLESEWTDAISSRALQTLKENKLSANEPIIPLTDDIMTFQRYLKSLTSTLIDSLEMAFSKVDFEELNQVTLARIVLFNRRRGGETQRLTVKAYKARLSTPTIPEEIEESFTPVEKIMCKTFSRIQIRGKKGRTVPVLLTPEIENSIEILLKYRKEAGVHAENEYLFARSNYDSLFPLRSTDVLRKYATAANVKNPKSITSTKLRKHVATVSQIINLSRQDMETVAEFMGHDLDVHRAFYRLPQETLQVVKMGKLLNAFDKGTVGRYKGMTLDEIPFDKEAFISSEDENESEIEDDEDLNESVAAEASPESGCGVLDTVCAPSLQDSGSVSNTIHQGRKDGKQSAAESCGNGRRKVQRLSEEQSKLLKSLFQTNILLKRELRRNECEKVICKYSLLKQLTWLKIKNTVHNWITTAKRKRNLDL